MFGLGHRAQPGADAGPHVEVADAEFVQATPLVGQLVDEPGQRCVRARRDPRGQDPDRQRQVTAEADQLPGGGPLGPGPRRADAAFEQGERGLHREDVEVEQVRPGQRGQAGPAGHQDRAAGTSGQQRPYLPLVNGVVEDDQQPPVGQEAAEHRHPLVGVLGNRHPGHPESAQEGAEHVGGARRLAVAAQVGVELAVGVGRA